MINPQMKMGLLDVCVLSVLSRGDSYGYKIIKDLSDYIKLSESTLYPILRRLEASDCLMVYTVKHNSRLRKMYKLTETGKTQIREFLTGWEEIEIIYRYIKEGLEHE